MPLWDQDRHAWCAQTTGRVWRDDGDVWRHSCLDSVTGMQLACVTSWISLDRYGHAASAADQYVSLLDQAVQTVALAFELLPRFCRSLCCSYCCGNKQASLDTFFGKSANASILKTSRLHWLQMLLTSLTSRTDHYQYFAFLFGIPSLQINIWSMRVSFCVHYVTCLQIITCTWMYR